MLNLGGSVLVFSSAQSSSASKGESVADTLNDTFYVSKLDLKDENVYNSYETSDIISKQIKSEDWDSILKDIYVCHDCRFFFCA